MYFKVHLKHTAFCACDMGISKEISQEIRKRSVDLHKSGSSLGTISRCLKVPRSSVQTIIRKSSHHTAQEGDVFCVPKMMLWCEICVSTPEQKLKTLNREDAG